MPSKSMKPWQGWCENFEAVLPKVFRFRVFSRLPCLLLSGQEWLVWYSLVYTSNNFIFSVPSKLVECINLPCSSHYCTMCFLYFLGQICTAKLILYGSAAPSVTRSLYTLKVASIVPVAAIFMRISATWYFHFTNKLAKRRAQTVKFGTYFVILKQWWQWHLSKKGNAWKGAWKWR